MKQIIRVISILILICTLVGILTSCNPSGTYVCYVVGVKASEIHFKGKNYTLQKMGMTESGTYKIQEDTIYFTPNDGEPYNLSYLKGKGYIELGGLKFDKQ